MKKREDLLRSLEELEKKLLEYRDKEGQTAEDVKAVNAVCDDIEAVNAELDTLERTDRALQGLRKPQGDPPKSPAPGSGEDGFRSFGEYLQAVAAASMPRGGTLGPFACGVYDRRLSMGDPELRAPTGMAESTPSLGGFLVQQDFASELFQKAHQASMVWQKCRNIPISGRANGLKIPGIDETSRADGSRWGGIRAYWLEEAGTKTASKPKFMMVELSLKKLIGLCYGTDELLEDAGALEVVISQGFESEFAFKLDDSVIRGTGAGQPLGVLNAASLVQTTRGSAGTLCDTDVRRIYGRMWPGSHSKSEWFTNVDCLPNLMQMTMRDNVAGAPLWLPANQILNQPYQSLMGRPLHYIESASTQGTVGDLMFLDLSQFVTITKGGMQAASSIHVQFTTDETAFRFVLRVDGQPLWNAALTPYKGTNTLSPFVTVGT
jgi:HK97 family phage major capsid protein